MATDLIARGMAAKAATSATYLPFPTGEISGTLSQVVSTIMSFPTKKQGMAYLGEIRGSCVSSLGLMNAECTVSFMTDNIAVLSISSSDTIPYHWEYNTASTDYAWKKWSDVSGTNDGTNWQTITINGDNKQVLPPYPTFNASKQYKLMLKPNAEQTAWELKWVEEA